MVWARIDDRANGNAKLLALSDSAYRMWAAGLIYCQSNLTDGHIPTHAIATFGVRGKPLSKFSNELTASLAAGKGPLWHVVEDGWMVHDYLDWNDSKVEVMTGRAATRERKERHKNASGTRSGTVQGTVQAGTTTTTTTDLSKNQKGPTAPTRELLTRFDDRHFERFGTRVGFNGAKDSKRMADLWRQRQGDPVTVEMLIDAFFQSRDKFILEAGFTVGVFISQIGKLVTRVPRETAPTEHWEDECKRLHGGTCGNPSFHWAKRDYGTHTA